MPCVPLGGSDHRVLHRPALGPRLPRHQGEALQDPHAEALPYTHPLPSLAPLTPLTPPPQRHTQVCHYFFFFINITPYPPLHPLHTHTSTRYDPAKSLRINSLDAHASKINMGVDEVKRSDFQFFRANGHTRPSVGQLHTFFPKRPRSEGSPSASNSATPAAVSLISSDSGSD